MTGQFRRLKDSDNALLQNVLASAESDAPSSARMRRAALNLGLPAAAATLAVQAGQTAATGATLGAGGGAASGASTVAGAGATASAGASSAALGSTALIAKWVGVGALIGLVTSGAATRIAGPEPASHVASRVSQSELTEQRAGRTPPRAPEQASPQAEPTRAGSRTHRSVPRETEARATPTSKRPLAAPQASSIAAFPAPSQDDLAAETALIDSARRALARGDAAGCLRTLDRYDHRVVHPSFGVEALMLRVRALVALGQRDRARALADRYISAHPGDVYAQKLQAVIGPRD